MGVSRRRSRLRRIALSARARQWPRTKRGFSPSPWTTTSPADANFTETIHRVSSPPLGPLVSVMRTVIDWMTVANRLNANRTRCTILREILLSEQLCCSVMLIFIDTPRLNDKALATNVLPEAASPLHQGAVDKEMGVDTGGVSQGNCR